MTKLDTEIKKKKEMGESEEYLRQVDKPEGWKYVGQYEGNEQKKEKKKIDDAKNTAQSKKKLVSYPSTVAAHLQTRMNEMDAGKEWVLNAIATYDKRTIKIYGRMFKTQRGVAAVLKTPQNKVFIKCVRTCGYPEVDIPAIDTLAEQVENTIDSEKGLLLGENDLKKTKSGIILPR